MIGEDDSQQLLLDGGEEEPHEHDDRVLVSDARLLLEHARHGDAAHKFGAFDDFFRALPSKTPSNCTKSKPAPPAPGLNGAKKPTTATGGGGGGGVGGGGGDATEEGGVLSPTEEEEGGLSVGGGGEPSAAADEEEVLSQTALSHHHGGSGTPDEIAKRVADHRQKVAEDQASERVRCVFHLLLLLRIWRVASVCSRLRRRLIIVAANVFFQSVVVSQRAASVTTHQADRVTRAMTSSCVQAYAARLLRKHRVDAARAAAMREALELDEALDHFEAALPRLLGVERRARGSMESIGVASVRSKSSSPAKRARRASSAKTILTAERADSGGEPSGGWEGGNGDDATAMRRSMSSYNETGIGGNGDDVGELAGSPTGTSGGGGFPSPSGGHGQASRTFLCLLLLFLLLTPGPVFSVVLSGAGSHQRMPRLQPRHALMSLPPPLAIHCCLASRSPVGRAV